MAEWKKNLGPSIELEGPWYDDPLMKKLTLKTEPEKIDDFAGVLQEAKAAYERELELFKGKRNSGSNKSESRWLKTVFQSGTSIDKINAHALQISESPVHNLSSVKALISLIELKVRRQCMQAVDALLQAFTTTLLPSNRKLLSLNKQNLAAVLKLNKNDRKKAMILFAFEEELKLVYDLFIKDIQKLLKDPVDIVKRKGITCLEVLLAHSPEQEQELLSQLVNKVGDPQKSVAAFSVSHLETLLRKHPNMKLTVVAEVERILYRPNVTPKAQYFGLCFLNQILLTEGDSKLATKLVLIYISFFKACIKKNEVSTKIMSALLAGVNRSYPFAQGGDANTTLAPHLDTLYRLVHVSQFNISVQALCLLHRAETVGMSEGPSSDRFYSALYRKLLDAEIGHSTKMRMLLNLLFRSLKADQDINRIRAFVKRLLQIGQNQNPGLLCGILYLISELFKANPALLHKAQKSKSIEPINSDSAFSDDEEHYEDAPLKDEGEDIDESEEKESKAVSSWVHRANTDKKPRKDRGDDYDPAARNPVYAHAQSCNFWELNCLKAHYHPSVTLFANTITEGRGIEYTGDPLQDFQLIRFLDRFVFRNPKTVETGNSNRRVHGRRNLYQPKGVRNLAVNSDDYLNSDVNKVPADEMVFYKYFSDKAKSSGKKPEDLESVSDGEFDDYMQSMTKANFAEEVGKKSKASSDDEEEREDNSDVEFDDEEDDDDNMDFEEDPEFNAKFKEVDDILGDGSGDDFDEENFGSEDEFLDDVVAKHRSKKSKKTVSAADFANAEDFADILEENAEGLDVGGAEQILNKDRAGAKQMKWEQSRDSWIKSDKWKNKKKDFNGKKDFSGKKKDFNGKKKNFGKVKKDLPAKGKKSFVKSKRK